jgi:hypothetical protein
MIALCLLLLVSPSLPTAVREDPPAAKSERVIVAGTHVKLRPPAGFVPAVGFTGFHLPDLGVSILVTEIPGPFAEVAKGTDEKGLRRSGMKLISRSDVTISGRTGLLIHASQTMQDVEYEKWMAIFGDEKNTVMVVGAFPKILAAGQSDALKRVVLDAEWDPTLAVDPFADLDWTVDVAKELVFAGRMQKVLTFNVEGSMPAKDPSGPMLIVAPSVDDTPIDDLKKYAEKRLQATALLRKFVIQRSEAVQVAGFDAWEIVASAEHEKSKLSTHLYQLMIVRPEGYILVQGRCTQEAAKQFAPLFEQGARSWKPKPKPAAEKKDPKPK